MKAAVLTGPGNLKIVEKPRPEPGAGEVLIEVKYCGICGSDLHAYDAGFLPADITIGHEFSGIIIETGLDCGNLAPGDRVAGNNLVPCRKCPACLKGSASQCNEMIRLGITGQGAMAEYILMPAEGVFKLPGQTPLEHAALAEPLSVGLHALNRAGLDSVDNALVIGAGAIGLVMTALVKRCGVKNLVVIEPNPARADLADMMGATDLINPGENNLQQKLDQVTGGAGGEVVFECAGLPETIQEACSLAGRESQVVILGICYQPVEINFLSLVTREISIKTAFGKTQEEFSEAVRLIGEGAIDLSPLISGIIPFSSIDEGFNYPARERVKNLVDLGA